MFGKLIMDKLRSLAELGQPFWLATLVITSNSPHTGVCDLLFQV